MSRMSCGAQLYFSHVAYQKEALDNRQKTLARLEEARPLAPQELDLEALKDELSATSKKLQARPPTDFLGSSMLSLVH